MRGPQDQRATCQVVSTQLPNQTLEPGPDEVILLKNYPSMKQFADDYKVRSRLGWRVARVVEPDKPKRPCLPVCILRRLSKRYQYRVVFVRKRF
jgi:hypothetical protein